MAVAKGFALLILALSLAVASSQAQRYQEAVKHEHEPPQRFRLGENGHREVEKQAFKNTYRMGYNNFKVEDGDNKIEDSDHKMEHGNHKMEDGNHKREDGDHKMEYGNHKMEDGNHKREDGDYKVNLQNTNQGEGGDDFRREGGDDFRREGGDDFRREGGDGFRREGGDDFQREGGNDFQREGSEDNDGFQSEVRMSDYLVRELASMQKEAHTKPPKKVTFEEKEAHTKPPKVTFEGEEAYSRAPKKVTFEENTDVQALVDRLMQSDHNEKSHEDDDNIALNQWMMVTSEGYEYHPTKDEVQRVLEGTEMEMKHSESSDPSYEAAWGESKFEASINATSQKIYAWDTRYKIYNTHSYPWSAMGHVESGCTGTFIGPRHILTAGHCVFNPFTRRWMRTLNFRRAKNCHPSGGYFYQWKYAVTVWGWWYGRLQYNYAVIVVNTPSPSWMSFGWRRPMPRYFVNIAGYPVDKPGQCMWLSHCHLYGRYSRVMSYYCDTFKGMSGASVYARIGYWKIVYGVHIGSGRWTNMCVRINRTRYRTLHYIVRRFR